MTPPAAASMPEPAAEPPIAAESAQLSLKVRTLDQRTYPITICAAASVPQLKELVAAETGVTLARQRLIYRGRVLKNDQTLSAYSLEDGHVLHLVVRAVPPTDAASRASASATSAPDPSAGQGAPPAGRQMPAPYQLRQQSSLTPPRDNDEPDPTMGRSGNVTVPFLNSMISNLVTQIEEGVGPTAARGRRRTTFSREGSSGSTSAEMEAATARALRHHHRNRDGSGRQRHGRRSSSTSAERQATLRARTGARLESSLQHYRKETPTQP
ncbi:ubiquitin family protein, putative [Phytophthora infestans T30-4]|uniref:Ubiquitin family protein, putative n=1 Tax=Phytophthora infestans (strain T30-4) TaxID=403677 RepID=D0MZH9_PHYIT|nr:ubiquitin family protein, putative [Phytophthora infestans T30-4]EEY65642.1 ubiquitin family protein, putative [Phytophthora infestans T30-4]|eukprot:XP_002906241.1 ubiquitin family protein, putative [Phytophthora infestans T30-4]